MFDELSYLGYTVVFCIPPLVLIWVRREFYEVLVRHWRTVVLATVVLTAYGSVIWPIAIGWGAWSYGSDKITGIRLFDLVFLEDVVWWFLISLLFSSFIVVSAHYEDRRVDILVREIRGFLVSVRHALGGLRMVTLERNATIHVAVAAFVILEAVLLRITAIEWLLVALAISSVMGLELLNSSVERIASRASTGVDEDVRRIKDAAAAGVLVGAAGAAVIGVVIFLPRLIAAFR